MSLAPLPEIERVLEDLSWDTIAPHYEALLARDLATEPVAGWLADWSRLEEWLDDVYTTLHIAYDLNTADESKHAAAEKYLTEIYPQRLKAQQPLKQKLIASGYDAPEHEILLRSMRNDVALFREENVPLLAEVQHLAMEYQRIMGQMTVQFDGKEMTIQQLRPYLLQPDRAVREAAWRAGRERQMAEREALHDLFDRMLKLRHQIALNAGFANYRDYMFRSLGRFDYTPDDCKAFHAAIEAVVVPAVTRRHQHRQSLMGLESVRPWDTAVDPLGREALKPFDEVATLISKTANIFDRLDPVLAGYYDTMARERLLELESRVGKAPGGYSTAYHLRRRAFIFMNAVGTHDDVQTLLHEAGHSFHTFEMSGLPLVWQRDIPMEIAEVASMAMELLAAPYLGEFYSDEEIARARVEHLEGTLAFLPYMAVVDAFQHWIYENPEHTHEERDAAWRDLMLRFTPGVDWSGLEEELGSYWQRQLHIFQVPFYYVEYGIAQVGAWQVWRNSLQQPARALAQYRAALALGYTRPLPELYQAAGARMALGDQSLLAELVALIEEQLETLEGKV
ncbi:MAG: M3 family oligoendopeptidase [Anaerolineae bacterium]